eukprot:3350203-Prymnesium_polylepis.1
MAPPEGSPPGQPAGALRRRVDRDVEISLVLACQAISSRVCRRDVVPHLWVERVRARNFHCDAHRVTLCQ